MTTLLLTLRFFFKFSGLTRSVYSLAYRLEYRVQYSAFAETFLFDTVSRQIFSRTKPPMLWVPEVLPSDIKRTESEADHLFLSIVEVMNAWHTSTSPYVFMV
jgi:hypothetical protein